MAPGRVVGCTTSAGLPPRLLWQGGKGKERKGGPAAVGSGGWVEEGRLHVCPSKASWPMQGLQRERHAQTNQKSKQRHKTPNSIK